MRRRFGLSTTHWLILAILVLLAGMVVIGLILPVPVPASARP